MASLSAVVMSFCVPLWLSAEDFFLYLDQVEYVIMFSILSECFVIILSLFFDRGFMLTHLNQGNCQWWLMTSVPVSGKLTTYHHVVLTFVTLETTFYEIHMSLRVNYQ